LLKGEWRGQNLSAANRASARPGDARIFLENKVIEAILDRPKCAVK
jgi:hypothetical protein